MISIQIPLVALIDAGIIAVGADPVGDTDRPEAMVSEEGLGGGQGFECVHLLLLTRFRRRPRKGRAIPGPIARSSRCRRRRTWQSRPASLPPPAASWLQRAG